MNSILLFVWGLLGGSLFIATALPQRQKLAEKRVKLQEALKHEQEVLMAREDARARYDALRIDPEYLELQAVDRLNVHRPGTTIYRINRER